jgi:hypothetical protein
MISGEFKPSADGVKKVCPSDMSFRRWGERLREPDSRDLFRIQKTLRDLFNLPTGGGGVF